MTATCTQHIAKDGSTTWWGRYVYRDAVTDARTWKRVAAPTKKACQQKIIDALAKISAGERPKDAKRTLGAFLAQWLDTTEPRLRATTHRRYAGIVRNDLAPALGDRPLVKLTTLDLQTLYTKLLRDGETPAQVAYIHTVLRAALSDAVRWGLVDRNVASAAKAPTVPVPEFPTWTASEVAAVFAVTDESDLAALWRLALLCGLRRGELLALWWEDVDLERGTLAIRRTLQKGTAGWQVGPPKTKGSRRLIALPSSCAAALRAHRDRQAFERQRLGDLWHDLPYSFTNRTGGPLHINTIIDRFQRVTEAAGVSTIRFHDLRHTYATLSLAAGIHPKIVSEVLGHTKIQLTLDRYSHVLEGVQRSVPTCWRGPSGQQKPTSVSLLCHSPENPPNIVELTPKTEGW